MGRRHIAGGADAAHIVVAQLGAKGRVEAIGGARQLLGFTPAESAVAVDAPLQRLNVAVLGTEAVSLVSGQQAPLHTPANLALHVVVVAAAHHDLGMSGIASVKAVVASVVAVLVAAVVPMAGPVRPVGQGDAGDGEGGEEQGDDGRLHGSLPPAEEARHGGRRKQRKTPTFVGEVTMIF
jgi:hypothetical protein